MCRRGMCGVMVGSVRSTQTAVDHQQNQNMRARLPRMPHIAVRHEDTRETGWIRTHTRLSPHAPGTWEVRGAWSCPSSVLSSPRRTEHLGSTAAPPERGSLRSCHGTRVNEGGREQRATDDGTSEVMATANTHKPHLHPSQVSLPLPHLQPPTHMTPCTRTKRTGHVAQARRTPRWQQT